MSSLRIVALPVLGITVLCAVVAAVIGGKEEAFGALVGGGLVAIFLSSSTQILEPATKANPELSLLVALTLFTGKVAVMVVLLAVFLNVEAVSDRIDSRALGLTLLITSLCSTALQIVAFRRARIPTYDLGVND